MISSKLNAITRSLLSHSDESWYDISCKTYKRIILDYKTFADAIQSVIDANTLCTESLQTIVSSFFSSLTEEDTTFETIKSEMIDVIFATFYLSLNSSENIEESTMKWNLFEAIGEIPALDVTNLGSMLLTHEGDMDVRQFSTSKTCYYICFEPSSEHYVVKEFNFDIPFATRSGSCYLLWKYLNIPENYVCYPADYFSISDDDAHSYITLKNELYAFEEDDMLRAYYKEDMEFAEEQFAILKNKFDELVNPSFNRRRHVLAFYFRNYD
jgi:hypothetical protein